MNETAEEYFRRAYEAQMAGELDRAVVFYKKSIELGPAPPPRAASSRRSRT